MRFDLRDAFVIVAMLQVTISISQWLAECFHAFVIIALKLMAMGTLPTGQRGAKTGRGGFENVVAARVLASAHADAHWSSCSIFQHKCL